MTIDTTLLDAIHNINSKWVEVLEDKTKRYDELKSKYDELESIVKEIDELFVHNNKDFFTIGDNVHSIFWAKGRLT